MNMNNLKKGDRLIYTGKIHEVGCGSSVKGKVYIFKKDDTLDGLNIMLEDPDGGEELVYMRRDNFKRASQVTKTVVCIDNKGVSNRLSVGTEYKVADSPEHSYGTFALASGETWDNGSRYGSYLMSRFVTPEEYAKTQETVNDKGEFIIWCPNWQDTPKKRYFTYKQARYVARKMSVEYEDTFYVMRAECVYKTAPCVSTTTKEEL